MDLLVAGEAHFGSKKTEWKICGASQSDCFLSLLVPF